MSILPLNAFVGRKEPPADADLDTARGSVKLLWDEVIARPGFAAF